MIKTEKIFSDGMVLQRGEPVSVWGACEGVTEIRIFLGDVSTTARIEGASFRAVLPALPASEGLVMEICGYTASGEAEKLRFTDVAVGEVWIAGGQSNMEFPLCYDVEAEEMLRLPEDRQLRFFDVPKICYDGQHQEPGFEDLGYWRHFCRENAKKFSSAAVFFAWKLKESLRVPVGIIGCNWGATSASCWMEEGYLKEYPQLSYYLEAYEQTQKDLDLDWYQEAYYERLRFGNSPRVKEIDEAINRGSIRPVELRELVKGLTPRQMELLSLPVGPMDHRRPCALFETMVKRIAGYGAKGALWYQGEADVALPDQYALLFSQLVRCWREHWEKKLPFLCVQLAPFGQWLADTGERFPILRAQQQRAADLIEDVWLASIMDHGMEYDIHPKSKRAAGERLALLALGKLYGQPILCDAPRLADVQWEKDKITLYMAHAGEGLNCLSERPEGLILWEEGVSRDFSAEVRDCRILLYCDGLLEDTSVQVTYAQQPYLKADLYNSAGLCAKPFVAVRPFDWDKRRI